ncbi:MAG: serine/threonine-protein kinase [Betaproteobacteria bacterium]
MISGFDMWLEAGLLAALVLAGLTAVLAKRYAARHNARVVDQLREGESVRLMALAFQSQGKLDAAWSKFQQVPAANLLTDDLYFLAVDYEKAGEAKKLMAVLKSVQERQASYRDSEQMLARARERLVREKAAAAASANRAAAPSAKPRFGAFEVQGELGKSALGAVYRGVDATLGREVAIKTLPLAQEFDGATLEKARARFAEELRRAAALSHPNIVTIYDTGEERGLAYVAMELVHGNDLAAFTAADRLIPVEKAVEIAARAAEALDHAHREGAVHYDVRPGNLIYDANSDLVKVTDFGIARVTAELRTKSGATIGVAAYRSPEQRGGAPGDARSDQYSLALALLELLTGMAPAAAQDALSSARVPPAVAQALRCALAASPLERFASCAELSGALTAAMSSAAMAQSAGAGAAEKAAVDIAL